MKGYVINLKCREDRLSRFQCTIQRFLPSIVIETVDAIDGSLLDLQHPELLCKIKPHNFPLMTEKTFRGVLGCCLSHLECYRRLLATAEPYAMIFEDDCAFIDGQELFANDILDTLELPEHFGIVWFNYWIGGFTLDHTQTQQNFVPVTKGYKTTESYIISREYAQLIYTEYQHNIFAMDAIFQECIKDHPEFICYTHSTDLFIQHDRNDTDIQFG